MARRLFIFVRTIAASDAANAGVTGQVDTSLSVRPVADEEPQRGVSSPLLAGQGACARRRRRRLAASERERESERERGREGDKQTDKQRERETRRFPDKGRRDEDSRIAPLEYQWRTRRNRVFEKNGFKVECGGTRSEEYPLSAGTSPSGEVLVTWRRRRRMGGSS